jgi:hypothetical protein
LHYIGIELFPDISWHHTILLFETFSEVAGGSEANGIGHLRGTLVGGKQYLISTVQTGGAQ